MDMDKICRRSRPMFDRVVLNVTRSYDYRVENLNDRDRVCFLSNDSRCDKYRFSFGFLCNREKRKFRDQVERVGTRAYADYT